tara:strand:- start:1367 stop:1936 length:570 start_codon:yes stop_codon:yes gene_type:complete
MISHKLIHVGDTVFFNFKGNHFTANILTGGLIGNCKITTFDKTRRILIGVTAFSSLTAWTEACLQDVLEEYYTRYSSWKRVSHKESKRSMGDLRDQCKLLTKKRKREEEVPELYKEIYRLQQTIVNMKQYIDQWENGVTPERKNWEVVSIRPVLKKTKREDEAKLRAQYIMMKQPRGIDLELYDILKNC